MSKHISKLLITLIMLVPFAVVAEPPPWAPAHGYRDKHKHKHYDDYDYYKYRRYYRDAPDYYRRADQSILSGTCNRDVFGGMIGGAIGGYAGSNIGDGSGRLAATAAGALLGYIIGQNIGQSMDEVDVRCTGYALEVAPDNQRVAWNNPNTGNNYAVTPTNTYQKNGSYCREYTSSVVINGRTEKVYGRACRNDDGSWQIVN